MYYSKDNLLCVFTASLLRPCVKNLSFYVFIIILNFMKKDEITKSRDLNYRHQ